MKYLSILALILMAWTAAVFAEEPSHVCSALPCTPQQSEIWNQFQKNGFAFSPTLSPSVYSGECYHRGGGYDSRVTHYSVMYLADSGNELHYSGEFAFFTDSDPYAGWTTEAAKKYFTNHSDPQHRVYLDGHSGEMDFSMPDLLWRYWIRTSSDLKTVYMVADWTTSHTVFCELHRH